LFLFYPPLFLFYPNSCYHLATLLFTKSITACVLSLVIKPGNSPKVWNTTSIEVTCCVTGIRTNFVTLDAVFVKVALAGLAGLVALLVVTGTGILAVVSVAISDAGSMAAVLVRVAIPVVAALIGDVADAVSRAPVAVLVRVAIPVVATVAVAVVIPTAKSIAVTIVTVTRGRVTVFVTSTIPVVVTFTIGKFFFPSYGNTTKELWHLEGGGGVGGYTKDSKKESNLHDDDNERILEGGRWGR